jgi:hypothetical protein
VKSWISQNSPTFSRESALEILVNLFSSIDLAPKLDALPGLSHSDLTARYILVQIPDNVNVSLPNTQKKANRGQYSFSGSENKE